ncbi:biotin-dependent carboxyltransferase family protein [Thalassococcus sp. CAU 1522]|uniref:Biotin-dependent carboxyltransferase family protein n=1 Tax=Thalassococcus arenae TaxID=2851652 RepID=A0ABS6N8R2_9RHOB|nr:biotin-dependent carboxyltransferase family protein [Thalassococcus arenae]MBV2360396.1 biotin-dependent carboxyltransferase family protein [Thalassococcus arenae]
MSAALIVHRAGPAVTVQDLGRPGWIAEGLSRGGALDVLALHEGAALLGQGADCAALEMGGTGGTFEATQDCRIALTGAPMRAALDGQRLAWCASHAMPAGARLEIGPCEAGMYGYLHVGGGIATKPFLNSRSAHLTARIGAPVAAGDRLPIGDDRGGPVGLTLPIAPRFDGGTLRVVPSYQTGLFADVERTRFAETAFVKDTRASRMGARLDPQGGGFHAEGGLSIVSDIISPGDIQMTGDGAPYVLLAECQTTGGYPRIGTVIAPDLPRVVQAPPGSGLRFRFVTLNEGRAAVARFHADLGGLRRKAHPLLRDPASIPDLLAYTLIGGVTAGDDL